MLQLLRKCNIGEKIDEENIEVYNKGSGNRVTYGHLIQNKVAFAVQNDMIIYKWYLVNQKAM